MLQITARIITGDAEYTKVLNNNFMRLPIWKICTETMKQLESEQYIFQQGFKRII